MAQKVEDKVKEFTNTKDEVKKTEDEAVMQDLLITAQQCVEAMDKEVASLKEEFKKISQEPRDKIARKHSSGSGSRTIHK